MRKELSFCAKTKLRVLGVVENMAEYVSPLGALRFRDASGADATDAALAALRERCPELLALSAVADVFPRGAKGGAEGMAAQFGAPFLGRVPLDPAMTRACEAGHSYAARVRLAGGRNLLEPVVRRLRASEPEPGPGCGAPPAAGTAPAALA